MNAASGDSDSADHARWARIPPPYRTAAVIIVIALLMATAFALSYSLALGRPAARHIPIGVVGDADRITTLLESMQSTASGGLQVVHYPSLAAAESAVDQ